MRLYEQYISKANFENWQDFYENFHLIVPQNFHFGYDVVDQLAVKSPTKRAMLWVDAQGNEREYTFMDVKRFSDKAANVFASRGIAKGDKVLLTLKQHPQFWFCMIALHKIGAVAIPATHLLTAEDYEYRFRATSIKMVVCTNEGDAKERIDQARKKVDQVIQCALTGGQNTSGEWLNFDALLNAVSDNWSRPTGENATCNEDTMLLFFTSGTEGEPKMVEHNFAYPLGHIVTGVYWQRIQEDGLHLAIADSGWAKSIWSKMYGQWLCEGALLIYDHDDITAEDVLKLIDHYKVTTLCAPPTIYRQCLHARLDQYDLSSITHMTAAGAPLNPEIFQRWKELTGKSIYEGYGQTETTLVCATFAPWMEPKPGAVGLPTPGYRVVVCDEIGEEVGAGVTGELCICTDDEGGGNPFGLFKGYQNNEGLMKSVWHHGLYHTGDMVFKDETGRIWHMGRADDFIKTAGYRVSPFEIEGVLLKYPTVLEVAVTACQDKKGDCVIKATIVQTPGYTDEEKTTEAIKQLLVQYLPKYKHPRIFSYTDKLPRTISGKIRRVAVREIDSARQNV